MGLKFKNHIVQDNFSKSYTKSKTSKTTSTNQAALNDSQRGKPPKASTAIKIANKAFSYNTYFSDST